MDPEERPVRRAADLVVRLEPDEEQLAALRSEVDAVREVDHDRDVARTPTARQAEVGGVVAPGPDRELEARAGRKAGGPRTGGVDDDLLDARTVASVLVPVGPDVDLGHTCGSCLNANGHTLKVERCHLHHAFMGMEAVASVNVV